MITKKEDFLKLQNIFNSVFTGNSLPSQVFKEPFSGFLFQEFDWAMTPSFWDTTIKALAKKSRDSMIYVAVIDPDPVQYIFRHFGHYNMKAIKTSTSGIEYQRELKKGPPDSPGDAMFYNSFQVIWGPSSKKWAIYGNRNYDACVLAVNDLLVSQQEIGEAWRPIDQALEDFICLSYKNQHIPPHDKTELLANYSHKSLL